MPPIVLQPANGSAQARQAKARRGLAFTGWIRSVAGYRFWVMNCNIWSEVWMAREFIS